MKPTPPDKTDRGTKPTQGDYDRAAAEVGDSKERIAADQAWVDACVAAERERCVEIVQHWLTAMNMLHDEKGEALLYKLRKLKEQP